MPVLDLETTDGLVDREPPDLGHGRGSYRVYERTGRPAAIYVSPVVLVERDGQHDVVRPERLPAPVDRPLDDGRGPDRARLELGRLQLDVLAVHQLGHRARASAARVDLDRYHYADFTPVPDPVAGRRVRAPAAAADRLDSGAMEPSGATAPAPPPRRPPGSARPDRPDPRVGHRRRRGGRRAVRHPARDLRGLHGVRAAASSFIEDYIRDAVLPLYANTHTESSGTGLQTTRFREEARRLVLEGVGGDPERHAVIFCGSGSTAAINRLVDVLELRIPADLDDR